MLLFIKCCRNKILKVDERVQGRMFFPETVLRIGNQIVCVKETGETRTYDFFDNFLVAAEERNRPIVVH